MTLSHISHTLPYSIERIWDTVTDLERFAWRSDIKEIKILDEHNFIEVTKNGTETHFHTTKLVAYNTWEFDLENGSIEGHWTGSFRQQGHETLVDFTENVVAKKWFLKPLLAPYLKRQQKQYLKDLQHELERNSSI